MHLSLGNVSVHDIGAHQWYQQAATGDIPPWRYVGCSVVVSAPDRSSHSIYVFGGWGNSAEASDGNVYVLSVPSFRWIRVNEDSSLRARHQCTLLGKNTMLVIGGIHPKGQQLQPFDTTGCDTSQMFAHGLGMFSLNNHTWSSEFDPSAGTTPYQVHPTISKIIGGTDHGGATTQLPVDGFSQQALGTLLGVHEVVNTTVPTKTGNSVSRSGKKGLGGAIIAGIVVGATVCIALTLALAFCLTRHWGRQNTPPRPTVSPPISLPIKLFRKGSELTAESAYTGYSEFPPPGPGPVELSDGKGGGHELGLAEKPLPPRPKDLESVEVQEMEGELGWHPAVREAMKREKMATSDTLDER